MLKGGTMKKNYLLPIVIMLFVVSPVYAGTVTALKFSSFVKATTPTITNVANTVVQTVAYGYAAANEPIFVKKAVQLSEASLANVVKKRAFSPYGIAFAVALAAADMYLNANDGTVTKGSATSSGVIANGQCSSVGGSYTSNLSQCVSACAQHFYGTTSYGSCTAGGTIDQGTQYRTTINRPQSLGGSQIDYYYVRKSDIPSGGTYQVIGGQGYTTAPQTPAQATDHELAQVANDAGLNKAESYIDPLTGKLDRAINELPGLENGIKTELDKMVDSDPLTNPSDEIQKATQTEPELAVDPLVNPSGSGDGAGTQEPPTDYTWTDPLAPVFDPSQDMPEKDDIATKLDPLYTADNPLEQQFDITAEGSECSTSFEWGIGGSSSSANFDWCSMQDSFNSMGTIIIGFALLFSGYILMGAKI